MITTTKYEIRKERPRPDGSFWRGVNPHTGYLTEVEVTSSSRCEVNVYEPDFVTLYQHEVCNYTFDQNSGEFRLRFDGDVVAGYSESKEFLPFHR